jgi:hypothetical protein
MSGLGVALFVAGILAANALYLGLYFRWERRETEGSAYFRRSPVERLALKRRIGWYSLPAKPLVYALALVNRKRATMPVFEYREVCGPPRVSSARVFERASRYVPQPEDVFVATQMRSGTTWMQQLVYQIVTRGQGDYGVPERSHLYAISPWIDALETVSIEDAPRVGETRVRIVKTHLPTLLCPYASRAKYIYVARHPVRCFASIVDFNRTLLGPLTPDVAALAEWFCSERMYWLPWPRHVDGWWRWAQQRDNLLFVHFEQMVSDFVSVRDAVARFLGYVLSDEEKARIDERCSLRYMTAHESSFEMAVPTMFSVGSGRFMRGPGAGGEPRDAGVPPAVRARILAYCREALAGNEYPAARFYADLAASGSTAALAADAAGGAG